MGRVFDNFLTLFFGFHNVFIAFSFRNGFEVILKIIMTVVTGNLVVFSLSMLV